MRGKILEALRLAKKFYNEELNDNHEHTDDELISYYSLESEIAEASPYESGYSGWYGAMCWLNDLLMVF